MSNLCGARDAAERWNPLRRTVDEWHVECSLVSLRRYTRGPAPDLRETGARSRIKCAGDFTPCGPGPKSLGIGAKSSPRYRNHGLIDSDGAVVGDIAMLGQPTTRKRFSMAGAISGRFLAHRAKGNDRHSFLFEARL